MLGKTERIHFVGIGGIGMSGLALIFKNLRFRISGSDIGRSTITAALRQQGIRIHHRHRKENVKNADVVVYSTAVAESNVELVEARRLGIPVIHRSELLAELTRIKNAVCISGTHGKTTTSSLTGDVLQHGGLAPTVVIGGIVRGKSQAAVGRGEFLVCEADESDRSFLKLLPAYAVITNVEPEHLDHYRDLAEIQDAFSYFASHVPFWGCVFVGTDSPGARAIVNRIPRRIVRYGLDESADLRAIRLERIDFGSQFDVIWERRPVGRFVIHLPGAHNVANALAAIGVGLELGIPLARIQKAVRGFRGVHRRIEHMGTVNGIRVYDDYGHHPTEIAVTLQTMREYFPDSRIISVFQPHRYTRTLHLFDQFALAFLHADIVLVTDIYPAHELPIAGVTGTALARRISREQDQVYYQRSFDAVLRFLEKNARAGDIVVVQGAGNINRLTSRILKVIA